MPRFPPVEPADPTDDLPAAMVMAVVTFLVFAGLMAGLISGTFHREALTWVGAGLVGLGSAVLAGWAIVLQLSPSLGWLDRVGGDLFFVGLGVLFVAAGLPTFAAGVI